MKWVLPLALVPAGLAAQTPPKPVPLPDFYDPPAYIVSGVTDYTNRGGHGSDAVQRSAESLTKATAAMSSTKPGFATESELRRALLQAPNDAMLHRSLGDLEEQAGRAVEALHEYQRAVELEPNEPNLFALASELLKHHAPAQAADTFERGVRLFPKSSRMLLGRATATYAKGTYDQAREHFFAAVDLNPSDPEPYGFLGEVQAPEITEADGFAVRMERFAQLHPDNAKANYYYACILMKRDDPAARTQAQTLLERAVRLSPSFSPPWFQLGVLFNDVHEQGKAIQAWERAGREEAHYRLSQIYRRQGDSARARQELEIYERLSKQSAEQLERERGESKRFVFENK